jgi:hypothetical protein
MLDQMIALGISADMTPMRCTHTHASCSHHIHQPKTKSPPPSNLSENERGSLAAGKASVSKQAAARGNVAKLPIDLNDQLFAAFGDKLSAPLGTQKKHARKMKLQRDITVNCLRHGGCLSLL